MMSPRTIVFCGVVGLILLSSMSKPVNSSTSPIPSSLPQVLPPKPVAMTKIDIKRVVEPSVVMINSGREIGSGSILPGNKVATCFHVVKNGQPVTVRLSDKQTVLPASVIGSDLANDVAILQVKSDVALPAIQFKDGVVKGEKIFALGSPFGNQNHISEGVVTGEKDGDVIFQASGEEQINPGNSGGPGVNNLGEQNSVVCGVNRGRSEIAYARPISRIKKLLEVEP